MRVKMLMQKKWAVLVASSWVQATAGITYVFGTYSSTLKTSLGYDQRHLNRLSVAKDFGDSVGLVAGLLCSALLPSTWPVLLLGAAHILLGYGCLWLLVVHKISFLPFWTVCLLIFLGTNGCTYLDTAALVSSIETFPTSRGTVVGLLKGFKGLSGAIFNQIYTSFLAPNESSFILMLAIVPTIILLPLLFVIKPALSTAPSSPADNHAEATTFKLLYCISVLLAAYMLGVTLVQDLTTVEVTLNIIFTVGLLLFLLLPLFAPIVSMRLTRFFTKRESFDLRASLLEESTSCQRLEHQKESFLSRSGPNTVSRVDPPVAREVTTVEKCKYELGDDFTLLKAVGNGDFWLLFVALCLGSGSGVTAINNLAQIAEAQGYVNVEVFVSLTNIWNFTGRLAGGYASEYLISKFGLPRTMVLASAQALMALGHIMLAMSWPSTIYVATLLVGAGYGAHWGVFPATLSELFGLKNFSVFYGVIGTGIPAVSLVFSGLIAGTLYDWEARKQSSVSDDSSLECEGTVCFRVTFLIMAIICLIGATLNVILGLRTRKLYSNLQINLSKQTAVQGY